MDLIAGWLIATLAVAAGIAVSVRWLGHQALTVAYAGSLVIAVVVAAKLGAVPGLPAFTLSASIFVYSATFIFTDLLSEMFGREVARRTVISTALLYPLVFLTAQFAVAWTPHVTWEANQEAFATTMGMTLRITIASACAFVASQLHDVWSYHYWKRRTGGEKLWLRNNASTAVSQLIDTVVFYTVGFFGVFPIGALIGLTYGAKLVIAAIDTPVIYAVRAYLTRHGIEASED